MTQHSDRNHSKAIAYIENLALPEFSRLEAADQPDLIPPDFTVPKDQAVTIGSQIAGFASTVDPQLRPHIANAFLLAQLAANKHIGQSGGNSRAWYDAYTNVLLNIGWVMEGDASSLQKIKVKNFQLHKEIIPIVTAALGPAVAATAIVLSVLNGLAAMNKDSPWITLFSKESQRAKANQFQISYTSTKEGEPSIKLIGFDLDASASVTQVLFFRFSATKAKLSKFEVTMSINAPIFGAVKDSIGKRVAERISQYVTKIEI